MAGQTGVWEQGPERVIYPMACWAENRTLSFTLQLSSSLPKTLLSPLDQKLNKPQALAVPYNNSLPRSTIPSSRDGNTAEPQDRQEMFLWTGCTPSHSWDAGGSATPTFSSVPAGHTPKLPIFQGSQNATPGSLHLCVSTGFSTYLQTELYRFINPESS